MSIKSVSIHNLVVVLVGDFNPSIITPSWLALKKLIRDSESENAEINLIHREISKFSLSFVEIQVNRERFEFKCSNQADFHLVKDLVVSIFSILSETIVKGIGINHVLHYSLIDDVKYAEFGNWLAPQNHWSDVFNSPKLLELKITEPLGDVNPISRQITISPSSKIKPYGVTMHMNYHIELSKILNTSVPKQIMENWDKSFDKIENVYVDIMKKFNNENN